MDSPKEYSPDASRGDPRTGRRDYWYLTLIFALALLLRGSWLVESPRPIAGDEGDYDSLALHLAEGKGFAGLDDRPTAWRTPGLPLVVNAVYRLVGHDPHAARLTLVLLSCATAPALSVWYRSLFSSYAVAMGVGLAWAFLPFSRRTAGMLLGEPLGALLLVLASILTVKAARKDAVPLALLAGVLFGYAILTRAYLILVVACPIAWLWLRGAKRLAVSLSLAVFVVLGSWSARNLVVMGVFTVSTQTMELWEGNNAWARGSASLDNLDLQLQHLIEKNPGFRQLGEKDRSRVFFREAVSEVINNPGRFLGLVPRKLILFFSPYSPYLGFDWLYALLLPWSFAGFFMLARDRQQRDKLWILAGPVAAVGVIALLTIGEPRFRHPIDPFLITSAGWGMHVLSVKAKARLRLWKEIRI